MCQAANKKKSCLKFFYFFPCKLFFFCFVLLSGKFSHLIKNVYFRWKLSNYVHHVFFRFKHLLRNGHEIMMMNRNGENLIEKDFNKRLAIE